MHGSFTVSHLINADEHPRPSVDSPLASVNPEDSNYNPRAPLDEEKVRSSMPIPAFLPWFDESTNVGETVEMRLAYRRMLADPNVKAAFLGKLYGVMAQDLSIRPWTKKRKSARRQADFIEWNLKHGSDMGIAGIAWEILSGALISGISVCEPVTEVEHVGKYRGKRILTTLKSKDPDNDIVPIIDSFGNIQGIQGVRYNSGKIWNPSDFIICKHLGLYGNPSGMSDFRAAYGRYWLLDTAIKVRGMAAQKRALPIVWAEYTNAITQRNLESVLENLKYRNWAAVPAGVKLQVLDIAGQSESFFTSLVRDLREEIFTAIAGATLQAMQGGAGTQRGSSQVHKDSADLFKWFLSNLFVDTLNKRRGGLIPWLINVNFAEVDDYPIASISGIDEQELAESLRIDEGLQRMGWGLDQEEMEDRYGRKFQRDPKKVLQQQQQGGGMMGGGMPGMGGGMPPGAGDPNAMGAAGGDPGQPGQPGASDMAPDQQNAGDQGGQQDLSQLLSG